MMTNTTQGSSGAENSISDTKNNVENDSASNASLDSAAKVVKKAAEKQKVLPPTSFMNFVVGVFEGAKISQEWQKAFDRFNVNENDEDRAKIISIAAEKDPDFKTTLSLAIAVLEGPSHAKSHSVMLSYVENIVNAIESAGENSTDTLFQSWLTASKGVSDIANVFYDRINRLKGSNDKPLSKAKRTNIFLIASIWLYRNQEVGFYDLIAFYSKNVYDIKGQSSGLIEPVALAYAAATATSTKKSGFSYLLFKLVEAERLAKSELRQKNLAYDTLEQRLDTSKANNAEMLATVKNLETEVQAKTEELQAVKSQLEQVKEAARNENIHVKDDKEDLRVKLIRLLEGDLDSVIRKAKTANSRIDPNPKTEIVDYQLDDALEIIRRELSWLKS